MGTHDGHDACQHHGQNSPEVQPWTSGTGAPSWLWGPCLPFLPYHLFLLFRTMIEIFVGEVRQG